MALYKENIKIVLCETTRPTDWILGMYHHIVFFYQVVQIMTMLPKKPCPDLHIFFKSLFRENKKSSCLKTQDLEPWYLACSNNIWTSTKFVQIMALGPKVAPSSDHIGSYTENIKDLLVWNR